MKKYSSYKEIDHDLRILNLQNQINKHKIKRDIKFIKEDLKPVSIAAEVTGSIAKKAVVLKILSKVIGK